MFVTEWRTYLSPVRSLPTMLITATLNTKLEKIVNKPAIPVKRAHDRMLRFTQFFRKEALRAEDQRTMKFSHLINTWSLIF